MGFPTERVLSDENHTAEFICAICQCLVEYPKLTPCSHTFCGACIDEWMKVGQMNCPTCKNMYEGETAVKLAEEGLGKAEESGRETPLYIEALRNLFSSYRSSERPR